MTPRGWQSAALAWALRTEGHRLIQAPPGCGKSHVGYLVAAAWLDAHVEHRVLWAAPSIALVEQAHATACLYLRAAAFICRAAISAPHGARLIITTHQSAIRFLHHARPTDLLIFDEAHHANQAALANFATCSRHTQCLGLSASPWSPGCERAFPSRWIYPLSAALEDGALVPLFLHADRPQQPAPWTLHFVDSVKEAQQVAAMTRALSFVQDEPTEKLGPWLRGRIPDLYVCGRLGEGYDVPACARVVIHRQTRSPIWIYQAVGRSLRKSNQKTHGHAYGICGDTQSALQHALGLADGYPASMAALLPKKENTHVQRPSDVHKESNHQGQEPPHLGDHLHARRRARDQTQKAEEGRPGI